MRCTHRLSLLHPRQSQGWQCAGQGRLSGHRHQHDGEKEVLGLWIAQTEGAKFWLQVVTELRNRGVQDIFIACVDGLKASRKPSRPSIPGQRPTVHRPYGAEQPELRFLENAG